MKCYIFILGLLGYWHNSYGMCSPSVLGRTIERLPFTNTNAFSQQEVPLNTVQQKCSYSTGGVVINYPVGWFTQAPNVRVTIQPETISPTVQYSTRIIANTATSTTVRVVKYDTANTCAVAPCFGGVCSNSPFCSGGTCFPTSPSSTCPSCNGSCGTTCQACADSTCTSICERCNGSCQGFCYGPSSTNNGSNCVGRSTICSTCNGLGSFCSSCVGTNVPSFGCAGIGTACTECFGTCTGTFQQCYGTTPACPNVCQGTGPCNAATRIGSCAGGVTCSYALSSLTGSAEGFGNGPVGSCNGPVEGFCSQVNASVCEGVCSVCSGVDPSGQGRQTGCNGSPAAGGICNGVCFMCTGSCTGFTQPTSTGIGLSTDFRNVPACSGSVTGHCFRLGGTAWNGNAGGCFGDCTGNGSTLLGASCVNQCNVANTSVEVAANEVLVHVYATADI